MGTIVQLLWLGLPLLWPILLVVEILGFLAFGVWYWRSPRSDVFDEDIALEREMFGSVGGPIVAIGFRLALLSVVLWIGLVWIIGVVGMLTN